MLVIWTIGTSIVLESIFSFFCDEIVSLHFNFCRILLTLYKKQQQILSLTEAYLEPIQTSKTDFFLQKLLSTVSYFCKKAPW